MAFQQNAISAPGGSSTFKTLTFANSNGVSFSNSNGSIIATVKTDYQTSGNYLTTAALSNHSHNLATTTTNGDSIVVGTANSVGATIGVPAYLTTAMASNRGSDFVQANAAFAGTNASGTIASNGISVSVNPSAAGVGIEAGTRTATTAGNLRFETGNGITFGLNGVGGSVMTASHNAITTGRASNDAIGLNTALTAGPLAWTVNSSGLSLNAGSAAGTTSGFGGNLISGSMTHNTAGLNLSLNHPAWLTTAMQSNAATLSNIRVSGGTTSNLLSALTFADSNGVSFGLNAGTMTATVKTDYLTSQSNQNITAGNGGFAFQTLSFSNVNGISFGTSAGSAITASHNAITTGRASNDGVGLNTAKTNVTWTVNSSGLSLDASGYAGTGTSKTGGAALTLNSNGLQFNGASLAGTTTGFAGANISGSMTHNTDGLNLSLSVAAPGAAAENNWFNLLGANTAGNTTASGSTIGYSGVNLTLSGTNGSVVNISAPATSSLSATGLVSISTNGSTISVGVADKTFANWEVFPAGNNTTFSSQGQNSLYLQKLRPEANYSFNNFELRASGSFVSSTNSQVVAHSIGYGLYSLNGATYSSISTSQMVISASFNSNTAMGFTVSQGGASFTTTSGGTAIASLMSGFKHLYLPFTSTLTAGGQYAFGINISSATTVGTSPLRLALLNQTQINNLTIGKIHATTLLASNTSYVGDFMQGVGSVTTGAMPSSIAESAITNAVSQARLYIQLD